MLISTFVCQKCLCFAFMLERQLFWGYKLAVIFVSTLKILFHCFLAFLIVLENLPVICGSFFPVAFKVFPLSLVFCSFTKMYSDRNFCLFIYFLAHVVLCRLAQAHSCVCECIFPQFWKILRLYFRYWLSLSLFYLFLGFGAIQLCRYRHLPRLSQDFQWSCCIVRRSLETTTIMQLSTPAGPRLGGLVPLCKLEKSAPFRQV